MVPKNMPPQHDYITANSNSKEPSWFDNMPSFQAFKDVTKDKFYQVAPDDWYVVITDVKGSIKAIEEGRYKDVNTIGAASISTVQNVLSPNVFPFVFGGDGATLLVSPTDIDKVLQVLLKLQVLSEENFGLGLRVGRVVVGEVHASGKTIEVAKHELTAGKCTAVFRGGGLPVAEAKIKGEEEKYCVQSTPAIAQASLELSGLSCRWNAIPSKRGKIMSLLVAACEYDQKCETDIYTEVLSELDRVYHGQLEEANPVNTDLLSYKSDQECLEDEKRYRINPQEVSDPQTDEIDLACTTFSKPDHEQPKWASDYKKSMRPHADHRKFDDMLRMILDCSEEQASQIKSLLEKMRQDKKIHYGTFLSETALMTCYLEDLADGHHIHFVDGGNGGYAMAATQLKAQMKGVAN